MNGVNVFHIDITEQHAQDFIVAIASHLPTGTRLGRLCVASERGILADLDGQTVLWGIEDDPGDGCWRMLELSDTEREVVVYRNGVEVSRSLRHVQPAGGIEQA